MSVEDGADQFRDAIRQLIRQGRVKLVINFQACPYIDSTALGETVRAYTSAMNQGGTLKLVNVTSRVHELLMITKLLSVFDQFDSEAEAVKSFGVARRP